MKTGSKWDSFIICLIVCIGIISLRLTATYPPWIIKISREILFMVKEIVNFFGLSEIMDFFLKVPNIIIICFLGIVRIIFGILFLFVFKRSMEQGFIITVKNPVKIIKNGFEIYMLFIIIILIYIYSVIGIPIAAIFLCASYIINSIGSVPLAVSLGYMFGKKLKIKGGLYFFYLFGSFIILLCSSVYGFSGAFLFFIFPVLNFGICMNMFLYRFVYKISYKIDYQSKKHFDREKIRDIIKRDFDKK